MYDELVRLIICSAKILQMDDYDTGLYSKTLFAGDSHRGRSSSLPNGYQGHHQPSNGYHRSGSMGNGGGTRSESMEDLMMRGLNPTSPSYADLLPEEHNYRTAERREVNACQTRHAVC